MLAIFLEMYYYKQVLLRRYTIAEVIPAVWLIGQAVKTPPSHGGNRGSIPLSAVILKRIAQPYKDVKNLNEMVDFWHFLISIIGIMTGVC